MMNNLNASYTNGGNMFFFVLLYLIIFLNMFVEFVHIFTYTDEILAIILLLIGVFKLIYFEKNGIKVLTNIEIWVIFLILIFVILGVFSTFGSDVTNSVFLQLYTLFSDLKILFIYFGARITTFNLKLSNEKISSFILNSCYLYTSICILLLIFNQIFHFLKNYGFRFGINTVAYGFGHPAQFSTALIVITTLYLYFNLMKKIKIKYLYLLLNLLLIFSAGRVTSIVFYLCLILILLFSKNRKASILGFFFSVLLAFWFSKDRIMHQFFDEEEARGVLLRTSIKIAQDYFPYGSGLGTFGSQASRQNYSSIYFRYNISDVWGLSPENSAFITDSYWAKIIGEYGFFGCIVIILIMILLMINTFHFSKSSLNRISLIPITYLFITSPVDTTMTSNSLPSLVFCTVILMNVTYKVTKLDKNNNSNFL